MAADEEEDDVEIVDEKEDDEKVTPIDGRSILAQVTAQAAKDDDVVPRMRKKYFFPLEMDVYQASLYFATTDDTVDSALFRTLASVKERAKRMRSRSSSSRGGSGDSGEVYEDGEGWSKAHFHKIAKWYARHRMLLFVSIIFLLQATLMHQFLYSVTNRSCSVSRECVRGTSCTMFPRARKGNSCSQCLRMEHNESRRIESLCFEVFDSYELLRSYSKNEVDKIKVRYDETVFLAKPHTTSYDSRVFLELCAGCVQDDGRWHTIDSVERETIDAMTTADFISLVVCGMAVALTVVGEIRETKIAVIAQKKIFRKTKTRAAGHVWFGILVALRAYLFVPQIMSTVPQLVIREGGNAVDLVFNTVAVVFIVEIDNLLGKLLSAPTLDTLRRVAVVDAPKPDHKYLSVTQKVYTVLIVVAIFVCVFTSRSLTLVLCLGVVYVVEGIDVLLSEDKPHLMRVIFATNSCSCTDWCVCCCKCCTCHCIRHRRCCCRCGKKRSSSCPDDDDLDDDDDTWRMAFVPEVRVPRRNEAWSLRILGADLLWFNFEFFVLIIVPAAVLLEWTLKF